MNGLFELESTGPKVFNKYKKNAPSSAVYIGRGSPYGNPFKIGQDGDRTEVISAYEHWVQTQPELLLKIKKELPGKDLVCFCFPQACHGDILIKIANSD